MPIKIGGAVETAGDAFAGGAITAVDTFSATTDFPVADASPAVDGSSVVASFTGDI